MKAPYVFFKVHPQSIVDALVAWKVSRPEMGQNDVDIPALYDEVRKQQACWYDSRNLNVSDECRAEAQKYEEMLLEVLAMQLPVREYVTCVLFFTQVPRAFVDQEDRARIGASHWQRSLRVVDLCNYATNKDYFRPKEIVKNDEASAVYDHAMAVCQEAYKALVDMGIRRDLARGVIPLHVNTAGSTAFNLNSILHLVAKRACYFAQGSYWGPIIKAIIEEMGNHFPPALMKKMFKLPCAGSDSCPYMKDIMDRMYDCSNPICPLVIERYIPEEGYAVEHVGVMTRHDAYFWSCENFPGYDEEYKKFLATFN